MNLCSVLHRAMLMVVIPHVKSTSDRLCREVVCTAVIIITENYLLVIHVVI